MPRLTAPQKLRIVMLLAEFHTYSETAQLVSNEFDIAIDRFQVRCYDPTNFRYAGGVKWPEIYRARRIATLREIADLPISSIAYRLGILERISLKAERAGNLRMAMRALKQAAMEVGGMYGGREPDGTFR